MIPRAGPKCGGDDLRVNVVAFGSLPPGPHLLPGLGSFLAFASMTVVVCRACGLVRFFAQPDSWRGWTGPSERHRVKRSGEPPPRG